MILKVVSVFVIIYFVSNASFVHAAGMQADLQCIPVKQVCGCGMVMGKKGCQPGANKFQCPCFDTTNGFTTPGVCVAQMKCQTGGGQQPQMPQMPQKQPSPESDPCGYTTTTATSTATTTPAKNPACDTGYGTNTGSTGVGGTGVFTFDTSIPQTDISGLINSIGSGIVDSIGISDGTGTSTSTTVATTTQYIGGQIFGTANGISGDIRKQGNGVSVIISSRNISAQTQTSGIYGQDGNVNTVFTNICATRPWVSNFLSFIAPNDFFDSLCIAHKYKVGIPQTVITTTKPKAKVTKPVESIAKPQPLTAQIWTVPTLVREGFRASIFWLSTGASACSVSSDDGIFASTGIVGRETSPPLNKKTILTITCSSASSTKSVVATTTINVQRE